MTFREFLLEDAGEVHGQNNNADGFSARKRIGIRSKFVASNEPDQIPEDRPKKTPEEVMGLSNPMHKVPKDEIITSKFKVSNMLKK